jgi:hypothetical protein
MVVSTGRPDGLELTNSSYWVVYYLTGQVAGLENHIGDELKVRGIETSPEKPGAPSSPGDRVPPTLQVTSVEVVTRKNPDGVPPVMGNLDTWVSYDNPEYGVRLRYPSTFTSGQQGYPTVQSNFAGEALTATSAFSSTRRSRVREPANSSAQCFQRILARQPSTELPTRERLAVAPRWGRIILAMTFIPSKTAFVTSFRSISPEKMVPAWTCRARFSGCRRTIPSS